jgi:hypothetical protein
MEAPRCCSGFEKIGCWLVARKASTRIGHASRVHNREQTLARLMVLGSWRYHSCSGWHQVVQDPPVTHTYWLILILSGNRPLERCFLRYLCA